MGSSPTIRRTLASTAVQCIRLSRAVSRKLARHFFGHLQTAKLRKTVASFALRPCRVAFRPTSETAPTFLLLPELPPKMTKIWGTTKLHYHARSQRDACLPVHRRTKRRAFQVYLAPFRDQGHTPFRDCCGYSRWSEEGRVSWPGRRRNSSRSSEGRVLGSRIGWLQPTVTQWLSADGGTASAFQRMMGARQVPDALWTLRRPDAC